MCLQSKALKADLPDYCYNLHILSEVNHNRYLSNAIKDLVILPLLISILKVFSYFNTLQLLLTFFSNLFSFSAENIIKSIYVF